MQLKKDAKGLITKALMDRTYEVLAALERGDSCSVVKLMQNGLLTYEDLVEPSKVSLHEEFWCCFSSEEIDKRRPELEELFELMQADRMSAAMDKAADLKSRCYIFDSSARAVFDLIEDYMNNRKEYEE